MRKERVIMHLDMDAFFVNVELLDKPHLRGQKIIVARNSPRSVVLSASYEARADGVGSAMPLVKAQALSPQALVIEPSHMYRDYSQRVMTILRSITDCVEQVSIDEAFLDLTSTIARLGNPVRTAQRIRERIYRELNLPASAGIATTKFMAKMASTGSKPDGLWVIPPHRVQEFLDPLPVGRLWGVGLKTSDKLSSLGIYTVSDLRQQSRSFLHAKFGAATGAHLYDISRGIDLRPVVPQRLEKSIGAEHTFSHNTTSSLELKQELLELSLKIAARLRATGKQTRSLSLKIRDHNFHTITRHFSLATATAAGHIIYQAAVAELQRQEVLMSQSKQLGMQIRLIGIRAEKIGNETNGIQGFLFDDGASSEAATANWGTAERAMDAIRRKYGRAGLAPASLVEHQQKRKF